MSDDRFEGQWKQWKGKAREQWGKLTDDDLEQVQGKRENLIGKLQERYGKSEEEAKKMLDDWMSSNKA